MIQESKDSVPTVFIITSSVVAWERQLDLQVLDVLAQIVTRGRRWPSREVERTPI